MISVSLFLTLLDLKTFMEASISRRRQINFPAHRRFMNPRTRLVFLKTSKHNLAKHTNLLSPVSISMHKLKFIFLISFFGNVWPLIDAVMSTGVALVCNQIKHVKYSSDTPLIQLLVLPIIR